MDAIEFVVTGVTVVEKMVLRFNNELPDRGVAWRDYSKLDADMQKLVDESVPAENANGKPKAKFAKQYQVHFEDAENGRKYLYDIKVTCFENGKPWTTSKALLEQVGPKLEGEFKIEDYFPVDSIFEGKLIREDGEQYWHINPTTLVRM